METVRGDPTLFDEFVVGRIMKVTGADEVTARFMLALHQGTVSGDVLVEGETFVGTPLLAEADPHVQVDISPSISQWRIVTGTAITSSGTIGLRFSASEEPLINSRDLERLTPAG